MEDKTKELIKMRIRWLRWLGQKTRYDKSYWASLLDCNWSGWAANINGESLSIISSRLEVKGFFHKAIINATYEDLIKLDNIYATEKIFG